MLLEIKDRMKGIRKMGTNHTTNKRSVQRCGYTPLGSTLQVVLFE